MPRFTILAIFLGSYSGNISWMGHPAVQVPQEKQAVTSRAASWDITSNLKFGSSSAVRTGSLCNFILYAISASIWVEMFSSSKRLTEIAPDGQATPHIPQPLHKMLTRWATLLASCMPSSIAEYGHEATQMPHPEQLSLSIDTGRGYPSFAAIFFRTPHTLENFTFWGQHFSHRKHSSEQYQI